MGASNQNPYKSALLKCKKSGVYKWTWLQTLINHNKTKGNSYKSYQRNNNTSLVSKISKLLSFNGKNTQIAKEILKSFKLFSCIFIYNSFFNYDKLLKEQYKDFNLYKHNFCKQYNSNEFDINKFILYLIKPISPSFDIRPEKPNRAAKKSNSLKRGYTYFFLRFSIRDLVGLKLFAYNTVWYNGRSLSDKFLKNLTNTYLGGSQSDLRIKKLEMSRKAMQFIKSKQYAE